MLVPSPPYYEEYYEQGGEEPADQPMDMNMLFTPDDIPSSHDLTSLFMMEDEGDIHGEAILR